MADWSQIRQGHTGRLTDTATNSDEKIIYAHGVITEIETAGEN